MWARGVRDATIALRVACAVSSIEHQRCDSVPYPGRPCGVDGAGSYLQAQAATHSSENACSRTACPDFDDIFSQTQGCRGRAKRRPAAGTGASVPAPGGGGGAGTGQELHLRKLRGRPQLPRGMSGVLRIRSPVQGSVLLQESKATRLVRFLGWQSLFFFFYRSCCLYMAAEATGGLTRTAARTSV